ncbi:hypothetical protein BS47DRAFT_1389240 [Hydnum rufescens UP504]|uniref:Uncharacterized protein n=1 Tax=Hydnum rufescens UP504 TaxID=1448309 RepID=A0A9P6B5I7_9AGAM|nr:hypothetical protein BS47DRAFT_1389240 [Hydnum rufescens UP504]
MAGTVDGTPRAALATLANHSSQLGPNATFTGPIDINRPITLPENLLDAVDYGNRSHHSSGPGPYKDEDVLLSLQLLGYLLKSPYLHQAFYKPRPNPTPTHSSSTSSQSDPPSDPLRPSMNIFSLIEHFTFRPSPSEPQLPCLPNEIQYWAASLCATHVARMRAKVVLGNAQI